MTWYGYCMAWQCRGRGLHGMLGVWHAMVVVWHDIVGVLYGMAGVWYGMALHGIA